MSFRNYNFIRDNKETVGTAILVKSNLDIDILPSKLTSSKLEYTAIIIKSTIENKPPYVFSIYNNSQSNPNFENDIRKLINTVPNHHRSHFIIGGDFNSKHTTWFNHNNNSNRVGSIATPIYSNPYTTKLHSWRKEQLHRLFYNPKKSTINNQSTQDARNSIRSPCSGNNSPKRFYT